jgi:hydrogenase maturation protein HypF
MVEPWRMALAHARASGADLGAIAAPAPTGSRRTVSSASRASVIQLLERDVACPKTSSVGRLFDAVASLAGLCHVASFEGQAAMALEAVAGDATESAPYQFGVRGGADGLLLDPAPVVRRVIADVARGESLGAIARRFHDGLAEGVTEVCLRIRARTGIDRVVLSGGVFVNGRLSATAAHRLEQARFHVHRHRVVPPNDGGLCLGQLAVLAALDAGSGAA